MRFPASRSATCSSTSCAARSRSAGEPAPQWHLIELNDDGDTVEIEAGYGAVLLFGHAEPIGAPVVAYGPFVMNTREEIMQAIQDYQAGKFNAIPAGRVA